jgi:hypothetical protein
MTLFGKILLFFNLLLAAGFVYLATQDWKGRQTITAAGVRHILVRDGLPLGADQGDPQTMPGGTDAEIPFRIIMAGGVPTETVSKKLLDTYFANAGDGGPLSGGPNPVPNQLAEVRRVKAKIDDLLKAAETPAAKVKLLSGWLLYQAETYDERAAIQESIRTANVEDLEKRLAARFAAVLDAPKPADAETGKKVDPADAEDVEKHKAKLAAVAASRLNPLEEAERRAKLAHLLVHLSTDAAWQKRVALVVGFHRYGAAISAQTEHFREMSASVENLIPADQQIYLANWTAMRAEASRVTRLAAEQAKLKLRWIEQKTRQDNFVAQRTTELNNIKAELKKLKAEVDALLAQQAKIEAALFEVQREVAITLDEVYEYEAKLTARERDLLGLPPKPAGN